MKFVYCLTGTIVCAVQINDMWGNNWAWLFAGSMLIFDSWWQQIEEYF